MPCEDHDLILIKHLMRLRFTMCIIIDYKILIKIYYNDRKTVLRYHICVCNLKFISYCKCNICKIYLSEQIIMWNIRLISDIPETKVFCDLSFQVYLKIYHYRYRQNRAGHYYYRQNRAGHYYYRQNKACHYYYRQNRAGHYYYRQNRAGHYYYRQNRAGHY